MPETPPARRLFTPDEYLILERRAEFKSEYFDGEIFAMSGATLAHNQIATNLLVELARGLANKRCQALGSDMRVGVTPRGPYFYPDVSVVCGKPQLRDNTKDCLMNPAVIVEVLSPSTESYDRTQKFAGYQRIATLTDFLLVSQLEPHIEHYTRQPTGGWLLNTITGLDSKLSILSIGCDLLSSRVYEQVEFEPANPA
jgi:Uma2 family endonuclease